MLMPPKLIDQLELSLKHPSFTLYAPSKRPCLPIHTIINLNIDLKQAASSDIIVNFLDQHHSIACAKALCGAIILDPIQRQGLLLNSIEVYGRDCDNDAHCEQQLPASISRRMTCAPPPPQNTLSRLLGYNITPA
ncbi:hypothetical protein BCV71DRAFT_276382 [Rhizopus microsporus]|uniref:Uncharacterized protein n=1 Tax=Rhizopus microsporus TaxID=58291 RepID=A0A1X0RQ91_RHIZD|nr:hypothetical protein BCV71DRAFT_276382 [Rhizopus microsporus]